MRNFFPKIFTLAVCIFPSLNLYSYSHTLSLEDISVKKTIEWETGTIYLDMTLPIPQNHTIFPLNHMYCEQFLSENVSYIIMKTLNSLLLDSNSTLGSYLQENPDLIIPIKNTYQKATRIYSQISTDFQTLVVRYKISLYPELAKLLITHDIAYELPFSSYAEPANKYSTGIVIYVKSELPLVKSTKKSLLNPSLFPKIFDNDFNVIFNKEMVEPNYIKKWGIVSYTTDLTLNDQRDRIGKNPLYLSARGIFGNYMTDIIISLEDSQKISNSHYRKLLKEGKIVLVLEKMVD